MPGIDRRRFLQLSGLSALGAWMGTASVLAAEQDAAGLSLRNLLKSPKFDTTPFTVTSGVRLGTPAGTTRGFGEEEFKQIGHWIADVVSSMNGGDEADPAVVAGVAAQVRELTHRFPIYG